MLDRSTISRHWLRYQPLLFGRASEELTMTPPMKSLIIIFDVIKPQDFSDFFPTMKMGRPSIDRIPMMRAFIAKSCLNIADNKYLRSRLLTDYTLRRVCGFDQTRRIPSLATFSNVFRRIAETNLPAIMHKMLVEEHLEDKLLEHISTDATAIPAREKAAVKPKTQLIDAQEPQPKKRGRPRKGEESQRIPKRLELQHFMSLEEMLDDLPTLCDFGTKKNSDGNKDSWKGYKLHLSVTDHGIPLSAILTSASVHDSQVAIPLEKMANERATSLYTLMDAGYHSVEIEDYLTEANKIAIIAPKKPRGGELIPLDPAKQERFKHRTVVERANARIKDDLAGTGFRVQGHAKVFAHLMIGILVLSAEQILRHLM